MKKQPVNCLACGNCYIWIKGRRGRAFCREKRKYLHILKRRCNAFEAEEFIDADELDW